MRSLFYGVCALTLTTFAAPTRASPGDPCPDDVIFGRPLILDIANAQAAAAAALRDLFGPLKGEPAATSVLFQDGVVSLGGDVVVDHAGVFFLAEPESAEAVPAPGYKVAFYVNAEGTKGAGWFAPGGEARSLRLATSYPGFVAFASALSTVETEQIAHEIRQRFALVIKTYSELPGIIVADWPFADDVPPDTTLTPFEYVRAVTAAWRELAGRGFDMNPNATVVRIPYEFGVPHVVTTPNLDVNALRSVSRSWLAEGWFFTTCPSLPAPWGNGPVFRQR